VTDLSRAIIASIEARGHVDRAALDQLRATYSVTGSEIAAEIDRILDADVRLAAKHRLAVELATRAKSRADESLHWLNEYRARAVGLGWNRDDLAAIVEAQTPARDKPDADNNLRSIPGSNDASAEIPESPSQAAADRPGKNGGDDEAHDAVAAASGEPPREDNDGEEFPIRTMVLGIATALILLAVALVIFVDSQSPRVNPAEQAAWKRAEQGASVKAYQTFIDQWPNSSRVALARDRLASLAERRSAAREQAARTRQSLIREAQQYLGILGYEVDVSGELDAATRQAITAFEQQRDLPPRDLSDPGFLRRLEDAWRAAEDEIWRQVRAEGTIESLARYLKAYPEGRHTVAARRRIEQLQDAAERRELIESIQRELVRVGRDVEVSGTLDARTTSELRDYRISKGQPEDAPVDRSLLTALRDLERWPPQPGETFVDCQRCPPMVVIPEGEFVMGSPPDELLRAPNEGPQHRVSVPRFALARTEVTFDQYRHCVEAGACSYLPRDEGWGQGERPVINVSMENAGTYVRWLSDLTGKRYRLPSEAEWEYAARGGTTTQFHTGTCLNPLQANFDARRPVGDCPVGDRVGKTLPVASFPPNPFGLHDMHGNVREWTLDCWNPGYEGAPTDGSAWIEGDCSRAVLRGGSWRNAAGKLRSASRTRPSGAFHNDHTGFRPAVSVGSAD